MDVQHTNRHQRPWRAGGSRRGLFVAAVLAWLLVPAVLSAGRTDTDSGAVPIEQRAFNSPEEAAEAFVAASESYDVPMLTEILGSAGIDLVITGDPVQDRNQAQAFASAAREKMQVVRGPKAMAVAILLVGADDWPLPIPIVKNGGGWHFDTEAGREEVLLRRIGDNELDAIQVCLGFVEAQHEYALVKHDGAWVNQYAQRIISTPGRQDGLAWRAPDGTWQGPVGEAIAEAIAEGYIERPSPYHGYYFKVLTGQGPAAPLGEMSFVIEGAMIGGFALAAAPVDYGVTGVMTFIVSHDGIVYEQDLGPDTPEIYRAMELFNPDQGWVPTAEE